MSMIPADLASRLRLLSESTVQPLTPASEISDKLSDLVPGQRVLAEIQAQLPNGAYRAMVAQRELVLALPFSAKSGDSLELEVVENDGRLALALLTKVGEKEQAPPSGVTASLSQAGKLISTLLSEDTPQAQNKGAILNSGAPILATPPNDEAATPQLARALQQAVGSSGMFYESHQGKWVGGQMPREALLAEPQGKLSRLLTLPSAAATSPAGQADASVLTSPRNEGAASAAQSPLPPPASLPGAGTPAVAPEATQLVQQQLAALANQVFAWQGQVWPGQDMRWEISEEEKQRSSGGEEAPRWQTSLHLQLPSLGGIDAELRLQGSNLTLHMTAPAETSQRLQNATPALHQALADAGLALTAVDIQRHDQG